MLQGAYAPPIATLLELDLRQCAKSLHHLHGAAAYFLVQSERAAYVGLRLAERCTADWIGETSQGIGEGRMLRPTARLRSAKTRFRMARLAADAEKSESVASVLSTVIYFVAGAECLFADGETGE